MFDIGWMEMMVIVIVMVIVIGPKDLPKVLYTAGQWVGRARAMARHFQDSLEEMARDAGADEMRDNVKRLRDFDLRHEVEKSIDPKGDLKHGLGVTPPPAEPVPAARPAPVNDAEVTPDPADPAPPKQAGDGRQ